ncbi:MAG: phosphoglucomutase/phosphomannomutase family protein [Thermacetogeniaceae bacterium]
MSSIRFGTDGWRARIADEFTFANVRLVAQAIARYVAGTGRGLVIGYDNRFQSERFAAAVAEVLAGNGIPAWLTGVATPTPVTAYAVRDLGTAGAVMITASHNSPEYNGIKFIPEYAGPAVLEITSAIEAHLDRLADADVKLLPLKVAQERGLVRQFDPKPAYLAHLHNVLKYSNICRGQLRVVIDPMWGAGIGYLEDLLREGCSKIEIIHGYRDILCGGQLPEPGCPTHPPDGYPGAAGLADLKRAVVQGQADLGLALDGDAGRFGVIDRDGSFISPNEVIYMLLHYLTEYRNWRGAVARTVATTHMIDRIAGDYGLPVVETPVGFKYISQSLIKHHSILGGEESGGLSIQGHIPEKDGILALAMVVEMASSRGKSLRAYQEEIRQKHGRLVSERLDLRLPQEAMDTCLERLQQWAPRDLDGQGVLERNTKDGVKLVLEDGSWVLVRASGTEPLFRIYAEAPDPESLHRLQVSALQVLGI